MKRGSTFIFIDPGRPHLWFIWSNPNANDQVVMFNWTTLRDKSDNTCILNPGDHPFVQQPSCISYQNGMLVPIARLISLEAQNMISHREDTEDVLLERIISGAYASKFTPHNVRDELRMKNSA